MQTFEDYLRDIHADDYMGNGDDMGEACDEWIGELDPQEILEYAQKWGNKITNK